MTDLAEDEFQRLATRKKELLSRYHTKLDNNDFASLLARGSWKASSVKTRYRELRELVFEVISEGE